MYDIKIGMDESGVSISERDAFNYTSQSGWDRNFQIGPGYFQWSSSLFVARLVAPLHTISPVARNLFGR
jgi:hypothetical protein